MCLSALWPFEVVTCLSHVACWDRFQAPAPGWMDSFQSHLISLMLLLLVTCGYYLLSALLYKNVRIVESKITHVVGWIDQ